MYSSADVWIPATSDTPYTPNSSFEILDDEDASLFSVIGRLDANTPVSRAESQLDTIARRFMPVERLDDPRYRGRQVTLRNGGRQIPMTDEELPIILGVTGVLVFLMLGVAAANVGTLLLARAAARRQEVGIRLALGASRMRILRQFLTESLVLALAAGMAGFAFGWGYKAIVDFAMVTVGENIGTVIEPLPMGMRMLAISLGLSLGCGLMFGIAPAFHAVRSSVLESMKPGAQMKLGRFRWLSIRNFLILQQVAGSLALLLLTGFIVLGVMRTTGTDPGFDSENLYMVSLDPIRDGYSGDRAVEFFRDLPERVERLAEVRNAALSYDAPVGMRSAETQSLVQGQSGFDAMALLQNVQSRRVGYRFVETLELPLLQGELLRSSDEENVTVPRVLVNETLAAGSWPGQQAPGQILELDDKRYQVAGVVADIQLLGLMAQTPPTVFRLLTDDDLASPPSFGMTLIVRSLGNDPIGPIRTMLEVTDPDVVLFNATTIRREVEITTNLSQINLMVYGGIGLFGLLLAAVGISGITAYGVVQRRKEIGLRLALGATRGSIMRLVTKEGAVLVGIGMVIGLGLAYAGARVMGAYFTGLAQATGATTSDPLLVVGAPLLLGLLTMVAAYFPARRALGISPALTLKDE